MSRYQTPLQRALRQLNQLIERGVDYPAAQYRASAMFGVDPDKLQAAYDFAPDPFDMQYEDSCRDACGL